MADSEKRNCPDKPHRSFLISDFSVRDIPVALLAYVIISAASIALGLAVESLPSFWRGLLFGIAVAMIAVVGLSQLQNTKRENK